MNRFNPMSASEEVAAEWCVCSCCLQRKHYTEFDPMEADCRECVKEHKEATNEHEK